MLELDSVDTDCLYHHKKFYEIELFWSITLLVKDWTLVRNFWLKHCILGEDSLLVRK